MSRKKYTFPEKNHSMVNPIKKQPNIHPEFSEKLKMLRKKRRWSQAQLAKKIGVEPQRISKYERALLYPTAELALRIADIFEVSMDYLFRNGDGADFYEIKNSDLLKYMREADRLPEERQKSLLDLLDAFIKRQKFEELIKS